MATYNLGRVGLNLRGAYDASANYEKLDVVTYNGSSYAAKASCVGILPTTTDYWQEIAEGVGDYVAGEVKTGRHWIDGKPIYRYVKSLTVSNSGTQTKIFDLPVTPQTIVEFRGVMKNAAGTQSWTVPYCYYGNLNWNLNLYTNGAGVYFGAGSSHSGSRQLIVIMEYTKATD